MTFKRKIVSVVACFLCALLFFSVSCFAESYGDNVIIDDFNVAVGDVNNDDFINLVDLVRLKKYLTGVIDDSKIDLANANLHVDTAIDESDLSELVKMLLSM